jgi:Ca2+-binding RTX toxin-like protein
MMETTMSGSRKFARRRKASLLFMGALVGAGTIGVSALPAQAAPKAVNGVSASFSAGILTVNGNAADNSITVSRNAAGTIRVNGGAVPVTGGTPTVANTTSISVFGLVGNDTLSLDETIGALPAAKLFGGRGNDTLTGGSAADQLFGQAGDDTLLAKGGTDALFGGAGTDVLTGGDADDQAFGEAGDDRMIWNPGDDTDLNEGGAGQDTTEVVGGNGAERFTATANGTRVRFDRVDPAPFSIDIDTTEKLVVQGNGGDDSFSATGNLAPLIATTVDGGDGNDTLLGTNGIDLLLGGAGTDFVDGQQANDVAFLGSEDDTFQWDPGDGSDVVEGQAGTDTLLFNGSAANENFDVSANGSRGRLFRDVAAITMDTNDVETFDIRALSGADNVVVNDLSGTDITSVKTDLAASGGGDDAQADTVTVNGTEGDDVTAVNGQSALLQVVGGPATVSVTGATPANDSVVVSQLAGDDVVDASAVAAGSTPLVLNGDAGDDVLIGGDGNDTINGGEGDDVLLGGPGQDVLDGGPGDNVVIQGEDVARGTVAGDEWLRTHARSVDGKTVIEHDGSSYTLPAADLV